MNERSDEPGHASFVFQPDDWGEVGVRWVGRIAAAENFRFQIGPLTR